MKRLFICFILLTVLCACLPNLPKKVNEQDDAILIQVLRRDYKDGGFTVVSPETYIWTYHQSEAEVAEIKMYVKEQIVIDGYDISPLLDKLVEKNKERARLSLKSSPANGYLIDYDGKFRKYFDKDGGDWEGWYKDNPTAHGMTDVSLPAYDEQTGIVLVYVGTQQAGLSGAGYIIAYRFKNGELKEIGRAMLYIS